MKRDNCPHCKRLYPEGWHDAINAKRNLAIKKAAENGNFGRPRKVEYKQIWELRDLKMSIQKIANAIGTSRGAVQHALKVRNKNES